MIEVINDTKLVKARKIHCCDLCCLPINRGSKYHTTTLSDGDIYKFKAHEHCEHLANNFDMYNRSRFDDGLNSEWYREDISEEYLNLLSAGNVEVRSQLALVPFNKKNWFVYRAVKKLNFRITELKQ